MKKMFVSAVVAAMSIVSLCAEEKVLMDQNLEDAAVDVSLKGTYFSWGKKDGSKLIVTDKAACSGKKSLLMFSEKGAKGAGSYSLILPAGTAGTKKTLTFNFMMEDVTYMGWQIMTDTTASYVNLNVENGDFGFRGTKGTIRYGKIIEPKTWYTVKLEMPNDGKSEAVATVSNKESGDAISKSVMPTSANLKGRVLLRLYIPRSDKEDVKVYMDDFRLTE